MLLTTVVRSGYIIGHLKSEIAEIAAVMLCFGLMLHPPPIYQSQSR